MTALLGFDLPILEFIQNNFRCYALDKIMPIISLFGEAGIFFIATALILMAFRKTRKAGISLGLSLLLGLIVCNCVLKPCFNRPRPYTLYPYFELIVKPLGDGSFPSGHATAAFEFAAVMLRYYRKWGYAALLLALLISFSRLYLFVHYPTDVICGAFVGVLCGIVGCTVIGVIEEKIRRKKDLRR